MKITSMHEYGCVTEAPPLPLTQPQKRCRYSLVLDLKRINHQIVQLVVG